MRARAMATRICVRAIWEEAEAATATERAAHEAAALFPSIERDCTRFDPTSALMRLNRAAGTWQVVPATLFAMLAEARRAHDLTGGAFDPRVLSSLVALGYAASFAAGPTTPSAAPTPHPSGPWRPRLRAATRAVHLRAEPVDLGGIGKGLSVRWAAQLLGRRAGNYLIEAGGDCYCAGRGPDDGLGWRVGVEDPAGGPDPLAVLRCVDGAVATSSIRVRHWIARGRRVHHLIDPRTGRPGGRGLRAVTVLHSDPALAEVWSKALFLGGASAIARAAERRGIAALWVDEDDGLHASPSARPAVVWTARALSR